MWVRKYPVSACKGRGIHIGRVCQDKGLAPMGHSLQAGIYLHRIGHLDTRGGSKFGGRQRRLEADATPLQHQQGHRDNHMAAVQPGACMHADTGSITYILALVDGASTPASALTSRPMQGGSLAAVLYPGHWPFQEEPALQALGQVLHQAAQ